MSNISREPLIIRLTKKSHACPNRIPIDPITIGFFDLNGTVLPICNNSSPIIYTEELVVFRQLVHSGIHFVITSTDNGVYPDYYINQIVFNLFPHDTPLLIDQRLARCENSKNFYEYIANFFLALGSKVYATISNINALTRYRILNNPKEFNKSRLARNIEQLKINEYEKKLYQRLQLFYYGDSKIDYAYFLSMVQLLRIVKENQQTHTYISVHRSDSKDIFQSAIYWLKIVIAEARKRDIEKRQKRIIFY